MGLRHPVSNMCVHKNRIHVLHMYFILVLKCIYSCTHMYWCNSSIWCTSPQQSNGCTHTYLFTYSNVFILVFNQFIYLMCVSTTIEWMYSQGFIHILKSICWCIDLIHSMYIYVHNNRMEVLTSIYSYNQTYVFVYLTNSSIQWMCPQQSNGCTHKYLFIYSNICIHILNKFIYSMFLSTTIEWMYSQGFIHILKCICSCTYLSVVFDFFF